MHKQQSIQSHITVKYLRWNTEQSTAMPSPDKFPTILHNNIKVQNNIPHNIISLKTMHYSLCKNEHCRHNLSLHQTQKVSCTDFTVNSDDCWPPNPSACVPIQEIVDCILQRIYVDTKDEGKQNCV